MAQKTIVFPTDFSHASDAALQHAEALAKQSAARLLIVHVEEPPLAYGGGELYYGLPACRVVGQASACHCSGRLARTGFGLPVSPRRTFAFALQATAHSDLPALRHPWLRWSNTPSPGHGEPESSLN